MTSEKIEFPYTLPQTSTFEQTSKKSNLITHMAPHATALSNVGGVLKKWHSIV